MIRPKLITFSQIKVYKHSTKIMKKTEFKIKTKVGITNCKSLVPYGTNLGSTINIGRLSKTIRELTFLPPNLYSIIVGMLLSDGWLEKENLNANTRFRFKQSFTKYDYIINSFFLLSHYCSSIPMLVIGQRKGTITYGLQLDTRRYPCFNELHALFYKNKRKIFPENIYELLTPIALAHLIMGDRAKLNKGLLLCTDSFSILDVVKLSNILIIKYGFKTSITGNNKNRPRIYILAESMPNLIKFVKPYVLESFWYKLQLNIYK